MTGGAWATDCRRGEGTIVEVNMRFGRLSGVSSDKRGARYGEPDGEFSGGAILQVDKEHDGGDDFNQREL